MIRFVLRTSSRLLSQVSIPPAAHHMILLATFTILFSTSLLVDRVHADELTERAIAETGVAVRQGATSDPTTDDMNPDERPVADDESLLPAARLPQYQIRDGRAIIADEPADPMVTLLLLTDQRPLLVKVRVLIDGLPFRMIRQQRIARLQSDLRERTQPREVTVTSVEANAQQDESSSGTSTLGRLAHYAEAIGTELTADEIHRWLNRWVTGPELVFLNRRTQAFRAFQKPAFRVLDRDRDRLLSANELDGAAASLRACDLNRDNVVTNLEVQAAARASVESLTPPIGRPCLFSLDEPKATNPDVRLLKAIASEDKQLARGLTERLKVNLLETQTGESTSNFTTAEADLNLEVLFDRAKPDQSRFRVVSVAPQLEATVEVATDFSQTISVRLPQTRILLSASQESGDQVFMGAVHDGYPLLPELDPNDDGRLTVRELRTVREAILRFDGNADGDVAEAELPATLRFHVSLGPLVHEELAELRKMTTSEQPTTAPAPAWFTRMDTNADGDLGRDEFPGTDRQFNQLDSDRDRLISLAEAVDAGSP